MILSVCIDNNGGMMFGNRRQSRDIAVCKDLLDVCKGYSLYMDENSRKLFDDIDGERAEINVLTSFDEVEFKDDDYLFIEKQVPDSFSDKISKLIIYKWNRDYPYDTKFDIDMSEWKLMSVTDFPGKSHENITREVYIRA